jgi:hypothetical protein
MAALALLRSGEIQGLRKALERRCEQGISVDGTARGTIQPCEIESCAQLKTARLLLMRDGDCCEDASSDAAAFAGSSFRQIELF